MTAAVDSVQYFHIYVSYRLVHLGAQELVLWSLRITSFSNGAI
jgi:hypothetical protein